MKQLFWALAIGAASNAWAQHSDWTTYRSQLRVKDIVECNGDIWVTTDRGVCRMNKTTMQPVFYDKSNSRLPDGHAQTITKDAAGNIWIGTYDLALVRVPADGSEWEVIPYPTLTNGVRVYSSTTDAAGNVWLGSSHGLLKYDGNQWQNMPITGVPDANNQPIWEIAVNSAGTVYAASSKLLVYENGIWSERDTANTVHAYTDAYICLENDTTVWYFTDAHVAHRYDGHHWQQWYYHSAIGTPALPDAPNISNLKMQVNSNNGTVYCSSYSKIMAFDGQDWTVTCDVSGDLFANLEAFYRDDNNDYWAFGKNRFTRKNATNTVSNAFVTLYPFNVFTTFANDRNGKLYLPNYTQGIYDTDWNKELAVVGNDTIPTYELMTFDGENEKWMMARVNGAPVVVEQQGSDWVMHDAASTGGLFPADDGNGGYVYFFDIAANNQGKVWVTYEDYSIFQYQNGTWSHLTNIVPANAWISGFSDDAQGNFWWTEYAQGSGAFSLKKYDGNAVSTYTYPVNNGYLIRPTIDENQHVWVVLSAGNIAKFDGSTWTTVSYPSTAGAERILSKNGQLFVATSGDGVWHYDGNTWTQQTTANSGLSTNDLRTAAFDENGDLWLLNNQGAAIDVWHLGLLSGIQTPATPAAAFTLYPNPAQTQIVIKMDLMGNEKVQILSANGQLMLQQYAPATERLTLDISHLAAGLYWLQVDGIAQPFVKR